MVFDTSYEALMDLGEQIGAVPRGLPPHITSALPSQTFGELDPSFIAQSPLAASMPLSPLSKGKSTARTVTTVKVHCSICLDEFTKHDLCITLECAHFFHQNCVLVRFFPAGRGPLTHINVPSCSNGSAVPLHVLYAVALLCPETSWVSLRLDAPSSGQCIIQSDCLSLAGTHHSHAIVSL